ncbi:MAG: sulfite exporter TauE/SafE family protein [Oscillospiraceae bacterium]|nr:sulfite exporter TauE/SafE family protein [Oscillospiraceae bacterium]
MKKTNLISTLAGAAAGCINGLFGAGGGMVLVPILNTSNAFSAEEIFSSSIAIILPICMVSLLTGSGGNLPWQDAWPFLAGGIPGGLLAGLLGKRIPTVWLHRFLGAMILYGGFRYLC